MIAVALLFSACASDPLAHDRAYCARLGFEAPYSDCLLALELQRRQAAAGIAAGGGYRR